MSMRVASSSIPLPGSGNLTLVGRSRAGDGTSFCIPELKWMFDCGALTYGAKDPTHIFLTHTHADHVTFLAHWWFHHANHSSQKQKPPTLYVPESALPFVQAHLQAHHALVEMSNDETVDTSQHLIAAQIGQPITLRRGGDQYEVTPIEAHHRVPCNGYSIFRMRSKLKAEYQHLSGPEIGKLRKERVQVNERVREPVFCYIGDSTHRVFATHAEILRDHAVIVTECTFWNDKDVARADETRHSHWTHLKPIVDAHPQTLFVLIHFSLKHSALQLLEFFNQETAEHRNVHCMLVDYEISSEWRRRHGHNNKRAPPPPKCQCFVCQPQGRRASRQRQEEAKKEEDADERAKPQRPQRQQDEAKKEEAEAKKDGGG